MCMGDWSVGEERRGVECSASDRCKWKVNESKVKTKEHRRRRSSSDCIKIETWTCQNVPQVRFRKVRR